MLKKSSSAKSDSLLTEVTSPRCGISFNSIMMELVSD